MDRRDFCSVMPLLLAGCGGSMEYQIQPSPVQRTGKSIFETGVQGTWLPELSFANPGDLSVTYFIREGNFVRFGEWVYVNFYIHTGSFTYSTASAFLLIDGLPYVVKDVNLTATDQLAPGSLVFQGITKANYTQFAPMIDNADVRRFSFRASGSGQTMDTLDVGDVPSGGTVILGGSLWYRGKDIS
jgi:hypothetical protein